MVLPFRNLPASLSSYHRRHRALDTSVAFLGGLPRHRNQASKGHPPTSILPATGWHHARRRYHTSLSRDNDEFSNNNHSIQTLSAEEIKRNNLISTRLYRILLKSSSRGVKFANGRNTIHMDAANDDDDENWILLQPPLDVRKYGHAHIFQVRRGELDSTIAESDDDSSEASLNFQPSKKNSFVNTALKSTRKEEVGRAMDVLRFVNTSLGGDSDDDLEDYYLGGSSSAYCPDTKEEGREEENEMNQFGQDDLNKALSATGDAAGRHSEGHYTQFLDEDEERGEEGETDIGSDDEKDEFDSSQHSDDDEKDDEDPNPCDPSVLVQAKDLRNAVRIAFRAPLKPPSNAQQQESIYSIITRRHRDAIDASSLLSEQIQTWGDKSSIFVDRKKGVRIVATSSAMHLSNPGGIRGGKKYKFAYRIRVENINDDKNKSRAVQLLGRTWNIYECRQTKASLLAKLLEDGKLPHKEDGNDEQQKDIQVRTLVQNVNEPKTGAVGHFPVIRPGEVFEYMSGAELATPTGFMEGCFHMAVVDPESTKSASIGEPVNALLWKENDQRKFEAKVAEFGFVAEEEEDER
ncbi:hypothetical protein HJC23_004761 [Cyclotella cryptica]|uniref:ApaG domain-containing protein n=1 Tax=Cyclotella cryptica TaxID=29204 RepID=A0ABD3PD09_9STRA